MLSEKQIPFQVTEIDLKNKPDWFLKISPYGKVPVLQHDDAVVYESAVINEYLDEVFPDVPMLADAPAERLHRLAQRGLGAALDLERGDAVQAVVDQDRVRDLRQQGKILPLSVIVDRLTDKHPGRILQVELENEHGRRVYEIQMILKGGILRTFHVDAHTGEILSTTLKED